MFNLKSLAIASTGDMAVRDASGEAQYNESGEPLTITFHSPGTKPFQKAKHAYDEKRSNTITALMTGKSDFKRTADDDLRETADFLAACTVSFNGFDYEGKQGFEAFKAAYMDLEIGHIANDANKFLGERGNFKKAKPQVWSNTSDTQPG